MGPSLLVVLPLYILMLSPLIDFGSMGLAFIKMVSTFSLLVFMAPKNFKIEISFGTFKSS